jgi:hypothetical protein
MKTLLYITLLLFGFGCNETKIQPKGKPAAMPVSKYKDLLAKFKSKSFDTLHVYSPQELIGEYKGIELTVLM